MLLIIVTLFNTFIGLGNFNPQKVQSFLNKDTIYVMGDLLIILENGKKFELENIANIKTTTVQNGETKNTFYLIYNYSASTTKSNNIVKLRWKNEKLKILKEFNYSFNNLKGVSFGWVIFYSNKDFDNNDNVGNLIKYELLKGKKCPFLINIFSPKDKFNEHYCLGRKREIPVFFENGELIGYYEYQEKERHSIYDDLYGNELLNFKSSIPIEDVTKINDIAYFLEQNAAYSESVTLLEKIIAKIPERTVAYINLGDAYWGLKDQTKAKEAYKKYIDLMKKSGKQAKIPKRVYDRVK